MRKDIKLTLRYIVLFFFMYLAWHTTSPEYLKTVSDMPQFVLMTINGSIFGALTLVLKSHFEQDVGE